MELMYWCKPEDMLIEKAFESEGVQQKTEFKTGNLRKLFWHRFKKGATVGV